ncbi:hypothetical protein ACMHYB_59990 [Sorangium sp. So ce1128]
MRPGAVVLEAQRVGQEPRDVSRVVDGAVLRPLEREADAAQGLPHAGLALLAEAAGEGPLEVEVIAAEGQRHPVAAGVALEEGLSSEERACLHARWIDQRAFQLNHPPPGQEPDWGGALALYASISAEDIHPFVSYRRDAGLAYGRWKLGDCAAAIALAEAACRHAGDSGFVRLRAMALLLLARILGDEAGTAARARALQIAQRLEDEELLWRGARLAPR